MRALVITAHGAPEVLRVEQRPDPTPGIGQVRVAVKAAGINFADVMARMGLYPDAPKLPSVVGYEFSGVVESLGSDVAGVAVGDRVLGGSRFGGYAEYVVTDAEQLIPLPADWSFEEGAAFPVNYATAYAGLCRYGAMISGERVLLHAAAGGVGIAATQIAKLVGAEVFGTASPSKHEAIRGFGVDHPIDYRDKDFVKEIRRMTGAKEPLDIVMDAVGGSSFRRSFSLLGAGGRLVCFGASSFVSGEKRNVIRALRGVVETPWFNPMRLMPPSKSVIGLNMLTLWDAKGSLHEYIQPLSEWIAAGSLRPVVAEAFPLEQGPEAHRFIQERKNVGKVVLTL
ncbi:MAG: zinc-binding dehydrogenase [Thermoleophilaceae bacterium]|nr:zinc-binding dehydrogenase [Thermoleophilaceae bacterium]